jgi:hypothetical protein
MSVKQPIVGSIIGCIVHETNKGSNRVLVSPAFGRGGGVALADVNTLHRCNVGSTIYCKVSGYNSKGVPCVLLPDANA